MQTVLIPADRDRRPTLVDVPGPTGVGDPIGARYPERVRIGDFTKSPPQLWTDGGVTVVMVCDEDGHEKGLPMNERASFLYGWSFHRGVVLGDVLVTGEHHVGEPMFGVDFTDLPEQYATVEFWERVTP